MKLWWMVPFVFLCHSLAFATCVGINDYEGTYQILDIVDAQMTCKAKTKGKLQLPGCEIILLDENSKSQIKAYANAEVCKLKKGTKSQMKISGSCCDVEEVHPCSIYKDRKFNRPRNDERYSCLGEVGRYVSFYSYKVKDKDVFRSYSPSEKTFVDVSKAGAPQDR